MRPLILDTNVVLDLLVFADAATAGLRERIAGRELRWLGTTAMRDELERVLDYPKLARRVSFHGRTAAGVLAAWDADVEVVEAAAKAPVTCGDPDDQKFIDLAVAHQALLLSKDFEVLRMRKRLAALDVVARAALDG